MHKPFGETRDVVDTPAEAAGVGPIQNRRSEKKFVRSHKKLASLAKSHQRRFFYSPNPICSNFTFAVALSLFQSSRQKRTAVGRNKPKSLILDCPVTVVNGSHRLKDEWTYVVTDRLN